MQLQHGARPPACWPSPVKWGRLWHQPHPQGPAPHAKTVICLYNWLFSKHFNESHHRNQSKHPKHGPPPVRPQPPHPMGAGGTRPRPTGRAAAARRPRKCPKRFRNPALG